MTSHTTERFRRSLEALPENIRRQARDAYRLFRNNPLHPSLRFKRVHPSRRIYSARVTLDYRALGVRDGDTIAWFWIGTHAEYDRLIAQL